MRAFIKIFSLSLLLLLISNCTQKPQPTSSSLSPVPTPLSDTGEQKVTPTISSNISPWATEAPDPSIVPIVISAVTRTQDGSEIISLANISDANQSLTGLSLLDPKSLAHVFLPDIVLAPGDTFEVCNGSCKTVTTDLHWLDTPVFQEKGDYVSLLNYAGRVIWNYVIPTQP